MSSLADELPREIERCIAIRGRFEELRGLPNVMVEPQIAMMSASITGAIQALASGDVVEMLRHYEDLKGWEE